MIGFGEARAALENKNNSDEPVRQTIFASMTFRKLDYVLTYNTAMNKFWNQIEQQK